MLLKSAYSILVLLLIFFQEKPPLSKIYIEELLKLSILSPAGGIKKLFSIFS